jgi:hypothetical protein
MLLGYTMIFDVNKMDGIITPYRLSRVAAGLLTGLLPLE